MITNFLSGETSPKSEICSDLNFTTDETLKHPPPIEIFMEMLGILVDTFRNFDLSSFFDENFNQCFQKMNVEFLRRFAKLKRNIDFAVECRKQLNQSKNIKNIALYSNNNFIHVHICRTVQKNKSKKHNIKVETE